MAFYFPQLENEGTSRDYQEEFLGYNHNIRIKDTEFYDMKNMTGDYYPVLSTRKNRGTVKEFTKLQGITYKNGLWWVENNKLYNENGEVSLTDKVTNLNINLKEGKKKLLSMGSYLIILPDKVYINTTDFTDCGYWDYSVESNNNVNFSICTLNGGEYEKLAYICDTPPNDFDKSVGGKVVVDVGDLWFDSAKRILFERVVDTDGTKKWKARENQDADCIYIGDEFGKIEYIDQTLFKISNIPNGLLWLDTKTSTLKKWAESSSMWSSVATSYIKISFDADKSGEANWTKGFNVDDAVTISNILNRNNELLLDESKALNGSHIVKAKGDNYIVITGFISKSFKNIGSVTIKRKSPQMDFIIEHQNRLWGCRYGEQYVLKGGVYVKSFVNEIYCCKQGDFRNWYCYAGISTDSYAVSVGSDGEFTGAVVYGGYPMFFKENSIYKVYGAYPSQYQIQEQVARGVQKGSDDSLCIVNETLFYKSATDVCMYDGSLPVSVSYALGEVRYSKAVGGTINNKYYISMQDNNGLWHLFVYDMSTQMWHKEDNTQVFRFCRTNEDLLYVDEITNKLISITGAGAQEDCFDWYAETGNIGYSYSDNKYIGRLLIRLQKPLKTKIRLSIAYDDNSDFETLSTLPGIGTHSVTIPILPRRCDHFRLRVEGIGECKIYSISKTIEIGSDC